MDPKRFSAGRASAFGANVRLTDIARRAMHERGFAPDFSAAVLKETTAAVAASAEANTSIRDLRILPWVSIDNDNSLDLDQLSVAQPLAGAAVKILVAIADVDAVVNPDTAIDAHAQINTTSVYTAAAVFPMLPEKLSTDLTCLREDAERLALIVDMTVADDGTVSESAVYRAVVRNHAKLAYNSVAAWLDGQAAAPARIAAVPGLDEQLRVQDRVAQAMNRFRHMHGALSLETIEARPVFEGDALTDIQLERTNRAKQLIENFMIAANGVVAKYLAHKGLPSLRRQLRQSGSVVRPLNERGRPS